MGRLVTVLGTHPGAGSALVAANLAGLLADGGRGLARLVELDDALGHLAADLGVEPTVPVVDVAALTAGRRGTGSAAELQALLCPVAPGLTALLSPVTRAGSSATPSQRLTGPATALLLEALCAGADVVVADAPPAFDDRVVAALAMADHVVVVTTPEGPAVEALALTLDSLELMQVAADRLVLVLNHSGAGPGPGEGEVLSGTTIPISIRLPEDPDLPATGIVSLDQPELPLSRAMRRLADRVGRAGAGEHPAGTAVPTGAGYLGLARRRRTR